MKVIIVGNHNPHFVNTMVYRQKALADLGHDVIFFDDRKFLLPGRVRFQIGFLHQWDLERLNVRLDRQVKEIQPQICFIVGGHRILPSTIRQIKQMGVRIVLWTTDAPVNFKNILASAPLYDHLFCAGSEAVDIFHAEGLKATWVPFACDPYYHKRCELTDLEKQQYARDMVFIGSYYVNRVKLLEELADYDLGVWGPYWQKLAIDSPLKKKAVDIKMNYDQWVKIYNASKINVVIHYQDSKVPCHQASPKLFESMACGAFVLCDRQKDAMRLFKDGEHLVYFDDAKDLRKKAEYYLNHNQERIQIARQGYEEALARHTYQDRFKTMLNNIYYTL